MSQTPWPRGHLLGMPEGENHPATMLQDPRFYGGTGVPTNPSDGLNMGYPNTGFYSRSTTNTTTFSDGTTVTSTTNISGTNPASIHQDMGPLSWTSPGHHPQTTYQPQQAHWSANQIPLYNTSPYPQVQGTYPWGNPLPATQYQAADPPNQTHYQPGQVWGQSVPQQGFASAWPGTANTPDTTPQLIQINTLREAQWALKMTILPPNSKLSRIAEEWWVDIGGGVLRKLATVLQDATMRAKGGDETTGQILGEVDDDWHTNTADTSHYATTDGRRREHLISWEEEEERYESTPSAKTDNPTPKGKKITNWGENLHGHLHRVRQVHRTLAKYKAEQGGLQVPPGCVREPITGSLLFDSSDDHWLEHVKTHLKAMGYSDEEIKFAWVDTSLNTKRRKDRLKHDWHGDRVRNSYGVYCQALNIGLREREERLARRISKQKTANEAATTGEKVPVTDLREDDEDSSSSDEELENVDEGGVAI